MTLLTDDEQEILARTGNPNLTERIKYLMDNPHLYWEIPEGFNFKSNCFGTVSYVINLDVQARIIAPKSIPFDRPGCLNSGQFYKLITQNYRKTQTPSASDIVLMWHSNPAVHRLMHSAVLLGGDWIFHQRGYGMHFEIGRFYESLKNYGDIHYPRTEFYTRKDS
jgi:hypothetical protein